MTDTHMADDWGAKRLAQRRRRRWGIAGALVIVAVAFPVLVNLLGGAHLSELRGGATVTPDGRTLSTSALLTIAFVAIVFAASWLGWRDRDEVERELARRMYAAIGLSSMALFPIVMITAPLLAIPYPAMIAWLGSIAIGGIVYGIARLRG
jgi:hypothetical protein